jgi:hypothetical protein
VLIAEIKNLDTERKAALELLESMLKWCIW